jgi:hypothetical protein
MPSNARWVPLWRRLTRGLFRLPSAPIRPRVNDNIQFVLEQPIRPRVDGGDVVKTFEFTFAASVFVEKHMASILRDLGLPAGSLDRYDETGAVPSEVELQILEPLAEILADVGLLYRDDSDPNRRIYRITGPENVLATTTLNSDA